MSRDPQYEAPFAWWGPGWQASATRNMAELLRDETIDAWTAANLWAALARRRSLAVVAGASGVGKTTLLTALLDFLPQGTRRIYVRGCFETFAFLADPTINPGETALLINELSPHLPVYLWGPAVGRVLEATQRGFSLLATAHAESVYDLVGALTGSPLHIAASRTAALEFVVAMGLDDESVSGRRIRRVWRLAPTREGVVVTELGRGIVEENYISQETPPQHPGPATWFPSPELARRRSILE
ncbi:MAG TPA: hypothetical protein VKB09_09335, partial [Thermomicrobiales bacterium]|nr:hypothetical protein [Thermomicrobiales bacterium]